MQHTGIYSIHAGQHIQYRPDNRPDGLTVACVVVNAGTHLIVQDGDAAVRVRPDQLVRLIEAQHGSMADL